MKREEETQHTQRRTKQTEETIHETETGHSGENIKHKEEQRNMKRKHKTQRGKPIHRGNTTH